MIKETLSECQFIDALKGDEYAGWSYVDNERAMFIFEKV